MQIQCPKCKQWTDSDNGACTACGAIINTSESGDNADEHRDPQLDDLTRRDVSNLKTRKNMPIVVIVLVVGFVGSLILGVILQSVSGDDNLNSENTVTEQPKSPYDELPEEILELPNGLETEQLAERTLEFYQNRLDSDRLHAEEPPFDSQWEYEEYCSARTDPKGRIKATLRLERQHLGYGVDYMFTIRHIRYLFHNHAYQLSIIPNAKVYAGVDDHEPIRTTIANNLSFRSEPLYHAMKTGKYLYVAIPAIVERNTSNARINIVFLKYTLAKFNDVCPLEPTPQEIQ
ncbi:MAG: hypothetical protein J6A01_11830 [Proteobacteria bacterium]|nr:hypothetical protein [Pseudomonadota bacterium]